MSDVQKVSAFDSVADILVRRLSVDRAAVTSTASIRDDLGADSLEIVDIVIDIETLIQTEISDEAMESARTVGDLVALLEGAPR